ncbi:hypothetical protein [Streptomyces sp. NPDC001348]
MTFPTYSCTRVPTAAGAGAYVDTQLARPARPEDSGPRCRAALEARLTRILGKPFPGA